MKNMPRNVQKWYLLWINQFPESWHPSDLKRFYMFVSVLIRSSRKSRNRYWLEENIRSDNQRLSDEDIDNYCSLFEHLQNYSIVWKSQQANLIAEDSAAKDRNDRLERKKEAK